MNRRTFLQSVTFGTAVASMSLAATAPKLRCGILGIDHAHGIDVLKVLKESPDFALAGVCEPDASVKSKFEDHPALKDVAWLSEDALLQDDSIRMIAVESGVSRLLDLARKGVDAGKHIHLDKPAGASLPEFRALMDEAEREQLLVQMGYMFRYNPGFDFLRRAVREGWLGEVYSINASMCTDLSADKRARIGAFSGGIMFELGCHLIDMIVLLMGAPEKVIPFVRHDAAANDSLADNMLAVFEYPNAIASLECTAMEFQAFPTRRIKVSGEKGSVVLTPLEPPAARLAVRNDVADYPKGTHSVVFDDLPRHVADFADFARSIRGESTFGYTKSHDLLVQEVVFRASGMPLT